MLRTLLAFMFAVTALACPALSADRPDLPSSLARLKEGQWVLMRVTADFGNAELKHTVLSITDTGDDKVINIRTEMSMDGELVDSRDDNITLSRLQEDQDEALNSMDFVSVLPTQVELKGVTVDAVEAEFVNEGKKCRFILTDKVPLIAMVRMEVENEEEPMRELIDFGE